MRKRRKESLPPNTGAGDTFVCAHTPGYECVSVYMQSPRRSEKDVKFYETIVTDGYELSMEVLGSEPRSFGSAARTLNS